MPKVRISVLLLTSALLSAGAASADFRDRHPHYLHALSDLRAARWMIEHRPSDPVVSMHEGAAIEQIDAALRELKVAAIEDGKDIRDHTGVDAPPEYRGRLHRALDLLRGTHADVDREEEDPEARGLKFRALGHIDEAIHQTEVALHDVERGR